MIPVMQKIDSNYCLVACIASVLLDTENNDLRVRDINSNLDYSPINYYSNLQLGIINMFPNIFQTNESNDE